MSVFSHTEFYNHEQVSFFNDEKSGLRAIIAVHNTHLGPALGGCRMWTYDTDEQALRDVLRLSRGMTYKAAVTGLPLGGGKSVIIGDSKKAKTPALMEAMGRAVESFGGRYIIAEDVGTAVEDMKHISAQTTHVVGTDGGSGDPSPVTAYGVYEGLKAAVRRRLDKDSLNGLKIAVQGLGNVGYNLCKLLAQDGADLIVTDIHQERIERAKNEFGTKVVGLGDIHAQEADVFSPCALGAILNDANISALKAKVVAGAANNQLAEARHGDVLRERKILYAPDYVINAGGLISVYYEHKGGYDKNAVLAQTKKIGETVMSIFALADQEGISTARAADRLAEARFMAPAAAYASVRT